MTGADPRSPGGVVFDIQRWSTHDGPGIRTTIFFKGCPLRCVWCCNPESWSPRPQLAVYPEKCHGCGACERTCPQGRRERCNACGLCAEPCPHGARMLLGRCMSVAEILAEVGRDQAFHRRSGGGVTFSGGEATCQPVFLRALAKRLSRTGTHLVLETCGFFDWSENAEALALMDLVYFDLKHMDSAVHERLTGAGNELILANAARIAAAGVSLIARVPLLPGLNDSAENLARTARFVVERLGKDVPVEVLPYHALGAGKHCAIGAEPSSTGLHPPTAEALERAEAILRAEGCRTIA